MCKDFRKSQKSNNAQFVNNMLNKVLNCKWNKPAKQINILGTDFLVNTLSTNSASRLGSQELTHVQLAEFLLQQ